MSSPAHPPPAYLLELRTPADLAAALAAVGEPAPPAAGEWERLRPAALRLREAAPALRSRLQELASAQGLRLYGKGPGLLLAGSRAGLRGLAAALRGGRPAADGPAADGLAAGGPDAGGPAGAGAFSRDTAEAIERCLSEGPAEWRWRGRVLDFRSGPLVMGVLNCTPDSFYPDSRRTGLEAALQTARDMIASGARILDVGGESTRPGSDPVPADEEVRRVVPVIEAIRRESEVLLSVDTRKPRVAEAALAAGADILNDVSALRADRAAAAGGSGVPAGAGEPGMAALAARHDAPLVLMHMRGEPRTMQADPRYQDVVAEVLEELAEAAAFASGAGVRKLIVDPGIGFGKRLQDNLCLLKNLAALRVLGCPVLIGLSRKSFLGAVTGQPVEARLAATIAADTLAALGGADILRVHDVREAVDAVRLLQAVLGTDCR